MVTGIKNQKKNRIKKILSSKKYKAAHKHIHAVTQWGPFQSFTDRVCWQRDVLSALHYFCAHIKLAVAVTSVAAIRTPTTVATQPHKCWRHSKSTAAATLATLEVFISTAL